MFTRATLAAVASVWLVSAHAASESSVDHVHAAFAFIRTGERTPFLRNDTQKLTAVGANQVYTLGQNLRTRYIAGDTINGFGKERIATLSTDILNNDQVRVQTLDTPYLVSSAQAFMQGLYPPHGVSNGSGDATELLADGTTVDYPLNGYQYTSIQAASQDDPKSILVSGSQNCPMAQVDGSTYLTTDQFGKTYGATESLYKSLTPEWFEGHLIKDNVNYKSAQEIYDYINYQFMHNSSIHNTLANDSSYTGAYDQLRYLADEHAWYMYGNTTTDADLQATGGKTLAAEILNAFRLLVASKNGTANDPSYPLTLFFGEQDSMMSLLSLMMLDSISSDFKAIPSYGSAMVFELFSTGSNANVPSDPDDLWVRFSFYNATTSAGENEEEEEKLIAYPMFNSPRSQFEMNWPVFQDEFSKIGIGSVESWCASCESGSSFCRSTDGSLTPGSNSSPSKKEKHGLSPAIAGVIGAIVTLVVAGLLFASAMLLCGLRFHRAERRNNNNKSLQGGFKGSSKLASDPDLHLAGNAASFGVSKIGHERLGSWELRQKEFGGDDEGFSFPPNDAKETHSSARLGLGVRKTHVREDSLGGAGTLRPAEAHWRG